MRKCLCLPFKKCQKSNNKVLICDSIFIKIEVWSSQSKVLKCKNQGVWCLFLGFVGFVGVFGKWV